MYRLSTKNQFPGTVVNVETGAVNGIVTLDVNGTPITATISMASIRALRLSEGVCAVAVVNDTDVMISRGSLRLSARNQFPGRVVSVEIGAVNAIVKMEALCGNLITAMLSIEAVEKLGLTEGSEVTAIVKATSVMIGR